MAETNTASYARDREIVPKEVRQIAKREKLGNSLQSDGSRIFLNGDNIASHRWSALVYELHEAAQKPNLIVILSDRTEWEQMNALRRAVVKNGGILQRSETGEFRSSVEKWIARLSQVPDPVTTAPPEVTPVSWEKYRGSFASDEEFESLVSELSNDSESGKSSIS